MPGHCSSFTRILRIHSSTSALENLMHAPTFLPCCVLHRPADALKFVTVFRSQLPQQTLLGLLQPCTALLCSESVVVHSYAATAIERFLALKEGGQTK